MRMHFLSIPVFDGSAAEAELNRFLASHRVVAVDRQLVADGPRSAWAVCVSYVDGAAATAGERGADAGKKKPIDYRDLLSPEDVQVFARLRVLRKEQLAAMVKERIQSAADLARIENIGKARVDKYGAPLAGALRLSRRRRRRYMQARQRWEAAHEAGQIGAPVLQTGYAAALAITAHARSAAWRREELQRRPAVDA